MSEVAKKEPKKAYKALVNMMIPNGGMLVVGQTVELSKEEVETIKKGHGEEAMKNILE